MNRFWKCVSRIWDSITVETLMKVAMLALVFTFALSAYNIYTIRGQASNLSELVKSNKKVLNTIEKYTSPEYQQEQDNKFNGYVLTISCNDQQNNQKVIDFLVNQGLISKSDGDVLDADCKGVKKVTPTVTTTTSAPSAGN